MIVNKLVTEIGNWFRMKKAYFNWSSGKDSSLALYYSMKSKRNF